ncbi:hypothetical protein BKA58DRAFT_422017 [Alternaria rosae]|uniref:uncharacterized protein n=1 Tax=Alternaria rosae TaxID=1187941 RepID=UPI001E8D33A0|nr:uncharacterized protein BKA58DRAFT_422017 [Alternaria rosae]KAH6868797.1 hypothetical protein BKA58DRAFT_422017 [Alternaria rosae]
MSQDQSPPNQRSHLSAQARARHRQLVRLSMFSSISELGTSVPHSSAVAPDVAQTPIDRHSLRTRTYYGTQELRPNEPVVPQPTAEDMSRRSQKSGVRLGTYDTLVRDGSKRRQPRIGDMEDITFGLNSVLSSRNSGESEAHRQHKPLQGIDKFGQVFAYSRSDEQAMDTKETQNGSTDESTSPYASRARLKTLHNEERGLEVNRDIPTNFNGRVPN